LFGGGGLTGYTCAKGGLNALTRLVALDYGKQGIRSNGIVVGSIASGGLADLVISYPPVAEIMEGVLLTRMGNNDDIANAAIYLASDEAEFVTGVVFPVDGGVSSRSPIPDLTDIFAELMG
jgi:NAD(P)-dependent dehydrogenase (short-subunit alcohol dehydrogenase family)